MRTKPKSRRTKTLRRSTPAPDGAISLAKINSAIATLKELADSLPEIDEELPEFSFVTDGKKAEVELFSASLNATTKIDFWQEVDKIGSDGGDWYHPRTMEFWIRTFREAADRLERDLRDCRSKPNEWKPLEAYN